MAIRGVIRDLLGALSSPNEETVLSASHTAGLLLERNVYYIGVLHRATKVSLVRFSERYDELRRLVGAGFVDKVHGDFRALLAEEYADLVLSEDEARAITDVLAGHLSGNPRVAADAADAFVRTDRVSTVPKLTEMLWRVAATDGSAAHSAIAALDTIIARAIPTEKPLSAAEEQMVRNACAALRFAAAAAIQHPLDPRGVAQAALLEISQHFGRAL